MKNQKNLTIGILCGVIFLLVCNITAFSTECKKIRDDTLRLHILANSDSEEDQAVKLKVRDAILNESKEIFDGTVTPDNAKEKILPNLKAIEKTANNILADCGFAYTADAELVYEYFDTRVYDNNVTLPAGKYTSVKISLGNAEGENWWCVMFPSLCLPAAEKTNENSSEKIYSETSNDIVTNSNKYELRFKIVEYIEKFKTLFD